MESNGATVYKLDLYRSEAQITEFILDTGKTKLVIQPPTGETLLEIAETSMYDSRKLLTLLCGEAFDTVWEAVRTDPAEVVVRLLQDLGTHFKIFSLQAAPGGRAASPSS